MEVVPRFACVLVPAETTEEIRELVVEDERGEPLACMLNFAKRHFARDKLRGERLESYTRETMSEAKKRAGKEVDLSQDLAAAIAEMELAEVVPLVPNKREFGFVAVNMTVDDRGIAKGLRVNPRATAIAARSGAGHSAVEVRGDAFFARQFDDDDGFLRMNFRAVELSSEAPWMRYRAHPPSSPVEMFKEMGTFLLRRSPPVHLEDAVAYYEIAAKLQYAAPYSPSGALLLAGLHANASFACLKAGLPLEALRHAEAAVETSDERWGKALARRADALAALGRGAEAREAYALAIARAPELRAELEARVAALAES